MSPQSEKRSFPKDFIWGSATASYQIEGGVDEDGRGRSIWDTFSHTPGNVVEGDTGDVADDHYHRWAGDVEHIGKLGLDAYRLSISWPRVQPGGTGDFNEAGIAFYSRLIDALLEAGVKPVVTLYHWDLPQELEDAGGWPERATAIAFETYARRMAQELGDRVWMWTTLNEPWCSAYLGYAAGNHAPGRTEPAAAFKAVHHLNLAHGLAARAIRDELGADTRVSVTLNTHLVRPVDPASPADQAATRKVEVLANEVFLGPMLEGSYPADLAAQTAAVTDWSFVADGDLDTIRVPLNVLGINYYSSGRVQHYDGSHPREDADGHAGEKASPWVGADDIEFLSMPGPYTAMGWNIDPEGFTELLVRTGTRFPDIPLMVTENGAAFDDEVADDGAIHDADRVDFLYRHLDAVLRARDAGVDLRGYFVWSLLDNFEWALGYSKRFGIIRVDYDTLERTWKDSAHWYAELVRTDELPSREIAAASRK